jgi:two-component system cell cycle response regulator
MARILVAEDDPNNLELITYLLKGFGHETLEAHDGAQALEFAQRERPDLVLMDIQMPVMDGYEAVRHLKSDSVCEGTPILAITALAMVGDRDKILQAGFDGYISKPIDPESFVQQLNPHLVNTAGASPRRAAPLRTGIEPNIVTSGLAPSPPQGSSVLVVDKLPLNIELLRSLLEPLTYQVTSASTVTEAMAKLRMNKPDLIVSDVNMPDLSGYDFIRAVKSESALRNIPFIFLSSSALKDDESSFAMSVGAAKFLTRPIEPMKLLDEIEDLLGVRKSRPIRPTILTADYRPGPRVPRVGARLPRAEGTGGEGRSRRSGVRQGQPPKPHHHYTERHK